MEPKTILVVEDDFDCLEAIVDALDFDGYRTISAANGEEALSRLEAGATPALILLDLMMPVMDGVEFLVERRRRQLAPGVKVLLVSGERDLALRADTLGADGFIQKPVELESLLATVREFCGG